MRQESKGSQHRKCVLSYRSVVADEDAVLMNVVGIAQWLCDLNCICSMTGCA